MKINYYIVLFLLLFVSSCSNTKQKEKVSVMPKENLEAKSLLQGIWVDDLTEDVVFKMGILYIILTIQVNLLVSRL